MVAAITDLPKMVSVRVIAPWGKNDSVGSSPASSSKLFVEVLLKIARREFDSPRLLDAKRLKVK